MQITSPQAAPPKTLLTDPFGRRVSYLRVSVTDRCDFRCEYCMAEDIKFLPKAELMTLEETNRLCQIFMQAGVQKIRLTGGEPLVRRNIMWLINELGSHVKTGRLDELTLTSNGSQLARFADELAAAGVKRLNISLDSLKPDRFKKITRWGDLAKVQAGLEAARAAGLKIKINCVALKGVNEDEVFDLIHWCHDNDYDLTFIEVMPMGDIGNEDRLAQYWPLSQLRQHIETRYQLTEDDYKTAGPARYFQLTETGQRLGFITPLTHNFCESCNRVRLTCTGTLYMCLGQDDKVEFRDLMRSGASDDDILSEIERAIARKPKGHDFLIDRADGVNRTSRFMSTTGG